MMLTLATGAASAQDSLTSSATQYHPLGTKAFDNFGGAYRYSQAVAATVAGSLYQAVAPIPDHLATTAPVVAIGAKSFSFTPGATAGAANLYAEGVLSMDTGPGNGYTYAVSGHAAITASVAFTLVLREPVQVAFSTATRLGLIANPFKNVIVAPTTLTAQPVGWATCVIATAEYGWLKTGGLISALIEGTPGAGTPLIASASAAGAVAAFTATGNSQTFASKVVAQMVQVGVNGKNNVIHAFLD